MSTPKKQIDVNTWLTQAPDKAITEIAPNGGLHIPIEKLEQLLDDCTSQNWDTENFKPMMYSDHEGDLCCYGSIELILVYLIGKNEIVRKFAGAANFKIRDIFPNVDWCATLKSYCVKNAATDAGKKMGRELNKVADEAAHDKQSKILSTINKKVESNGNQVTG